MLPAPIANDYVDANPVSWPSDFDAGPIPAAIVDFRPIEALVDYVSFDPDGGGGQRNFFRSGCPHVPGFLVAIKA